MSEFDASPPLPHLEDSPRPSISHAPRPLVSHPGWLLLIAVPVFLVSMLVCGGGLLLYVAITKLDLAAMGTSDPTPMTLQGVTLSLAGLITLLVLALVFERRRFDDLGKSFWQSLKETGLGFALGTGLIVTCVAVLAVAGAYQIQSVNLQRGAVWVLAYFGAFFLIALSEETLTRGILFRYFEQWLGTWAAVVLSAVLFGAGHLSNPNASPLAAISIAIEAGVLLAFAYAWTRNLCVAIGIHWAWNFMLGPVFGLPVSGIKTVSLLQVKVTGSPLLTGGEFGPEASVTCIVVCSLLSGILWWVCVRKGALMAPLWVRRRQDQERVRVGLETSASGDEVLR